jgi:TPP-dependent pyruvate/acetoin dehydrogenase alpha subunit
MGTHLARHQAQTDIARKADAYGIPAEAVDGMDVLAMESATRRATDQVRAGNGPFLVEARTYRFRAHSMYDAELYRAKTEVEEWKKRDPILLFERQLRDWGLLTDGDRAKIESAVADEVQQAVAFAEAGPWELVTDLLKDVHTLVTP